MTLGSRERTRGGVLSSKIELLGVGQLQAQSKLEKSKEVAGKKKDMLLYIEKMVTKGGGNLVRNTRLQFVVGFWYGRKWSQ